MVLSNDPVTSFSRETVAGVTGESGVLTRSFGDEIWDTLGKYPSFLGETGNTGNTSMISKS